MYAATPEAGGAPVAIKLARADQLDAARRLGHELRGLAEIGPPHVPAVFAHGVLSDGAPYVVMELLCCPTLADRLAAAAGPMAPRAACGLVCAALRALEAIHRAGYVHRDIKPENVFVDDELRATIVDLGVASKENAPPISTAGALLGTAEYMAPEQCEGRARIDARADIYAMGVILYELLAGRPPFWGPPAAVRQHHRSRRPPRLTAWAPISPVLERVVMRCLAKDPDARFDSAGALRVALKRAALEPTVGERAAHGRGASSRPSARVATDPPTSSGRNERRTVGLLTFDGDNDVPTLRRWLVSLGGALVHAAGGRCVAVFDHEAGASPAPRTIGAARELLQRRACACAIVDLAPVLVQRRRDGTRRFLSPMPSRQVDLGALCGADGAPQRLYVTPAVAVVLPEVAWGASESAPASGLIPVAIRDDAAGDTTARPLIGRADVIDALVEGARAAAADQAPTMVSVLGDTGVGKSHLAGALARRLREIDPSFQLIELRAREPVAGGTERTVQELLQQALELPQVPPPGAPRATLTVAAGEALRHRAARAPLIVVIDDAHAADEAALSALEYAALAEARAPLWICAIARPTFERARPAWGERALRRATYRLGPLDRESAIALCRQLLAPAVDVPEPALRRLVERAQAIPRLLVELVLGLKRAGIVRRHPRGDASYLATDELDRLPEIPLLEWLARGELDALPPALQEHARLVALLGPDVTQAEIAAVLQRLDRQGAADAFPLDAGIATERLLAAGVLVHDRRRRRLGFRHALVREVVARSTPEPLRREIHRAAFAHHRAAGPPGDDEARSLALAYHAAQAGLASVAEEAYFSLADRARARQAYIEAEALYSRGLEQGGDTAAPPTARRAAAHRGRGLMRGRIGRYHDALEDFAIARAAAIAAQNVAAEVDLLLDEATVLDWMDEYRSSEERVEQARARASRLERVPQVLSARLHLAIGRSLHRFSREREAADALARAAEEAAALGDVGYETLVVALLMLGLIYPGLGRTDDAGAALDRAIALAEGRRDALHLVSAISNRALLWACRGDKDRLVQDLARALSLAREQGLGALELMGEHALGESLYLMDDLDAAAPHIERAVAIEHRRTGGTGRPVVLLLKARFLLCRGDEEGARAVFERIRDGQEAARVAGHADALLAPSEEVLCDMIDLATQDAGEAAWAALADRSERTSVGQEHVEVLERWVSAAVRRGRLPEARRALERALDAAERIPNAMDERLQRRREELCRAID